MDIFKSSVMIENISAHNMPARCIVPISCCKEVPLKDLTFLDANVICEGERIPCKRVICDEKRIEVLFSAAPESELEYKVSLYINKGGPVQYAPYIGGGGFHLFGGQGLHRPAAHGLWIFPGAGSLVFRGKKGFAGICILRPELCARSFSAPLYRQRRGNAFV